MASRVGYRRCCKRPLRAIAGEESRNACIPRRDLAHEARSTDHDLVRLVQAVPHHLRDEEACGTPVEEVLLAAEMDSISTGDQGAMNGTPGTGTAVFWQLPDARAPVAGSPVLTKPLVQCLTHGRTPCEWFSLSGTPFVAINFSEPLVSDLKPLDFAQGRVEQVAIERRAKRRRAFLDERFEPLHEHVTCLLRTREHLLVFVRVAPGVMHDVAPFQVGAKLLVHPERYAACLVIRVSVVAHVSAPPSMCRRWLSTRTRTRRATHPMPLSRSIPSWRKEP